MDKRPLLVQAFHHIKNGNVAQLDSVLDNHTSLLKQSLPFLIHEAIACDQSIILCNLVERINKPDFTTMIRLAIMYRAPSIIHAISSNPTWNKKIDSKQKLVSVASSFYERSIDENKHESVKIVLLLQNFGGNKARL